MDTQDLQSKLEEYGIDKLSLNDLRGRDIEVRLPQSALTSEIEEAVAKIPEATSPFNDVAKINDVTDLALDVSEPSPGGMG